MTNPRDITDEVQLERRSLWRLAALPLGLLALSGARAAPATGHDTTASRLDRLESEKAVARVLTDYARANDRVDETLLRSCFWPESRHHHGSFNGMSTDFIGFAMKILRGVSFTAHHISNVSIDVRGDRAFSECYYFAHHRRNAKSGAGEEDAFFEGRYLDLFEQRGGVWKIIQRRGLADYTVAVPAATPFASWPVEQRSGRAPDDDYYRMRDAFLAG